MLRQEHDRLRCLVPAFGERIEREAPGLRCPGVADGLLGCETAQGLEATAEVIRNRPSAVTPTLLLRRNLRAGFC
jgi:hypothetical protein